MQIDVHLNKDANKDYKVYIDELETLAFLTKVLVITNATVAPLHLDTLKQRIKASELNVLILPDGEIYKNFETLNLILEACFTHRLDRKSLLIAFGGGVIGDMVGFAASIFQRGINFIQIPTTLLAQVDASVGGKTGINNSYGKNLIGSFWQPRAVYCESSFLKTLPKREFNAGVAEIIKMAVMFDKDFFTWLQTHDLNNEENLKTAIYKSIALKAKIVSEDETEQGIRAVLNYGHTFAHVIENQTNYAIYLHGEAVAMGIVMANALARLMGFLTIEDEMKIQSLLKSYMLPTHYEIHDLELFYDAFFLDKKSANNKIKFILANGIGDHKICDDISKERILEALGEFYA